MEKIKQIIYFLLIVIPFVASFSSALVNTFIGLTILFYLIYKISKKQFPVTKTPIGPAFLSLIIISLFSFFNSVSLRSSIGGIEKLLKYGFLFMALAEFTKDKIHLRRIAIAIICGLYLASLDGFYQLYFGKDLFRGRPCDFVIGIARMKATFPHTNVFAVYLALFLPLLGALFLYYAKGKRKILLGLSWALITYALFLTFSRGAIAGMAAAFLFMALVRKNKLVIALLIAALILIPFMLPNNIKNWVKNTDYTWEILLNKTRMDIYRTSLNMIKGHPFLGVGVNTYCLNYQKYKVRETYGSGGEDLSYYAHNIFLHMASEIGLFGLFIFLWLLFIIFVRWKKFYFQCDSDFLKVCSLGIIGGIIAFLVNGLTETTLYYSKIAPLFWYQVGILLGILRINNERAKSKWK
ncbi:MAG: O-antigen ligase family protein [Candidatus Omnitrophica bacterium]|nr:O-antigen ligase family protein [Candidatus Omnitrophota bacterium]